MTLRLRDAPLRPTSAASPVSLSTPSAKPAVKLHAAMHSKSCGECLGNLMPEDLRDELYEVRASRGESKIEAGAPISRMRPPAKKATRDDTSRMKPISWMTISMVMPSAREQADGVEDLGYELGIERRGDLVEQQDFRLERQRPRDGDALLLPA